MESTVGCDGWARAVACELAGWRCAGWDLLYLVNQMFVYFKRGNNVNGAEGAGGATRLDQ